MPCKLKVNLYLMLQLRFVTNVLRVQKCASETMKIILYFISTLN